MARMRGLPSSWPLLSGRKPAAAALVFLVLAVPIWGEKEPDHQPDFDKEGCSNDEAPQSRGGSAMLQVNAKPSAKLVENSTAQSASSSMLATSSPLSLADFSLDQRTSNNLRLQRLLAQQRAQGPFLAKMTEAAKTPDTWADLGTESFSAVLKFNANTFDPSTDIKPIVLTGFKTAAAIIGSAGGPVFSPLLSLGLNFFIDILGGLFSDTRPPEDPMVQLYNQIMSQIPGMIDDALLKKQLENFEMAFMDITETNAFWMEVADSSASERKDVVRFLERTLTLNTRTVFGACWDGPSTGACKNWQKIGFATVGSLFAQVHISSLMDNAVVFAANSANEGRAKQTAQLFKDRAQTLTIRYGHLLQGAFLNSVSFRTLKITQATVEYIVTNVGRVGETMTTARITGGVDNGNSFLMTDCAVVRNAGNKVQESPTVIRVWWPGTSTFSQQAFFTAAVRECVFARRAGVASQFDKVRRAIGSLSGICTSGYILVKGDVPGGDAFGMGFSNPKVNIEDCARNCSATLGCRSFEWNPQSKNCYRNRELEPTDLGYYNADQLFCSQNAFADGKGGAWSPLVPGRVVSLWNEDTGRWIRINAGTNTFDGNAVPFEGLEDGWIGERFRVVDAGDGHIVLQNCFGRMLAMTETGTTVLGRQWDSSVPFPAIWTWERFVVVPGADNEIGLWNPQWKRFLRMNGATNQVMGSDIQAGPRALSFAFDQGLRFRVLDHGPF